jgi:hypothetical protein
VGLIKKSAAGKLFLLAILCVPLTVFAQEEDNAVPFVDGEMWEESSRLEKVSYIVGLSNLLDAEFAFQQKSGSPPTADQSIIKTMWENIDDLSIDDAIHRIDQWYENNPDDMPTVVIDVIWVDMVEPNL